MGNNFLRASSHGDVLEATPQMLPPPVRSEAAAPRMIKPKLLSTCCLKNNRKGIFGSKEIHKLDDHEVGRFIRDAGRRANFSRLPWRRQRTAPVVTKLKAPLLFDKLHGGEGA